MTKRNDWTDYELGFIQDHDDWTAARIGHDLGRSAQAVAAKRWKIRGGWTPKLARWTAAEDDFLIANTRLSTADAASHLGRTEDAVRERRKALKRQGLTGKFGGNWSPTIIGARPLLAKTCPDCGLLLQAMWFKPKDGTWTRLCKRCTKARENPPAKTKRASEQGNESRRRLQSLTLACASHHGEPWTESDFKVLADPDLTILQKALTLGRSYSAAQSACHASGFKSKVGLGDPERDQWIIDNPNAGDVEAIAAVSKPPKLPDLVSAGRPAFEWDDLA